MDGCLPTARGRQPTFSNTRDFSFSHSNASILEKILFSHHQELPDGDRQLSIYGNVGAGGGMPFQPTN